MAMPNYIICFVIASMLWSTCKYCPRTKSTENFYTIPSVKSIIYARTRKGQHSLIYFVCHILGSALECYVCSNQTDNAEKCLNTIKTCEQGEDVCLSEIRWGSQPYFSQGALKQYYVSKKCSTKQMCTKIRNRYMRYCTHIWYEDWTCSECCQGDRCNYYIIVSEAFVTKQESEI